MIFIYLFIYLFIFSLFNVDIKNLTVNYIPAQSSHIYNEKDMLNKVNGETLKLKSKMKY